MIIKIFKENGEWDFLVAKTTDDVDMPKAMYELAVSRVKDELRKVCRHENRFKHDGEGSTRAATDNEGAGNV